MYAVCVLTLVRLGPRKRSRLFPSTLRFSAAIMSTTVGRGLRNLPRSAPNLDLIYAHSRRSPGLSVFLA